MKLRPMAIALVHHPVLDRRGDTISSAVTNLDIHDLARLATTYGLARFYLVVPVPEQQRLVERIVAHWREGFGAGYNTDRRDALGVIATVASLEEAEADWRRSVGGEGTTLLTGARHDAGLDFDAAAELGTRQPLLLVLGTGHGLADVLYTPERRLLNALRAGHYNHLSVRTAAAIMLDRLVGETGEVLSLKSI